MGALKGCVVVDSLADRRGEGDGEGRWRGRGGGERGSHGNIGSERIDAVEMPFEREREREGGRSKRRESQS